MNTTLTVEDKKEIKWNAENNHVVIYLKNRDSQKFQVGDILNKLLIDYEDKWQVEHVSYKTKSAKKYVFMGEDEYGVGYVKALKADGKEFIKGLHCLASFNADNIRFQVDPEFATATLLGSDGYDHNAEYDLIKSRRKRARADNQKIVVQPHEIEEFVCNTLSVGDLFWVADDLSGHGREQWEIIKRAKKKPGDTTRSITVKEVKNTYTFEMETNHWWRTTFRDKPVCAEDLI